MYACATIIRWKRFLLRIGATTRTLLLENFANPGAPQPCNAENLPHPTLMVLSWAWEFYTEFAPGLFFGLNFHTRKLARWLRRLENPALSAGPYFILRIGPNESGFLIHDVKRFIRFPWDFDRVFRFCFRPGFKADLLSCHGAPSQIAGQFFLSRFSA